MAQQNSNQKRDYVPAHAPNLALVDSDRAQLMREDESARILLFRQTYLKTLTDPEWELLYAEASARGLSVLHKEIDAIKFGGQLAIFPTIHGMYKLANRTGEIDGMTTQWSGDGMHWRDAWVDTAPPAAARCTIYKRGSSRPIVGVATWNDRARFFTPTRWDESTQRRVPTGAEPTLMEQWKEQPARMLGKCAEAAALRMTGLLGDIDPRMLSLAPYGDRESTATVVEEDLPLVDPRAIANRNAHRAAGAALGPGADAHALVRETVVAQNPDIASVSQATAEELNTAAAIIDVAGTAAPLAFDPDGNMVDVATGELIPTDEEEWRATVAAVLEAEQTTESLTELRTAAGTDPKKWATMIAHPKLSGALADRYVNLAVKACGEATRPQMVDALERRQATKSVVDAAGVAKTQAAQSSMAGMARARDYAK
jgi:hypothetical protein